MKELLRLLTIALIVISFSCEQKKKEEPASATIDSKDTLAVQEPDPVTTPYPGVDISPMDMCYFPVDYPKLKMAKTTDGPPLARVIYSRPHLQRRRLFPDILKFGEPWRLGANEATELQLFSDATIQGRKIPAGRYVLYCIPQANRWTIVINTNIDSWGLQPDASKDIARFEIPTVQNPWKLEYFSMIFEKTATGAELLMAWDSTEARLPISFSQ